MEIVYENLKIEKPNKYYKVINEKLNKDHFKYLTLETLNKLFGNKYDSTLKEMIKNKDIYIIDNAIRLL